MSQLPSSGARVSYTGHGSISGILQDLPYWQTRAEVGESTIGFTGKILNQISFKNTLNYTHIIHHTKYSIIIIKVILCL